jgi:glycosyltransferase involved in cell wall biosynthesis
MGTTVTPAEAMRVLVVGQTPPPYGGQAVMIRQFLDHPPAGMQLFSVRMAFSADMESIGRFQLGKLWHLICLVLGVWVARWRHRVTVLYFPPAGPQRVPAYRDFVILGLTRFLFRHTVFHFHASGISLLYPRLNIVERALFRRAYSRPDVAILTSAANPADGAALAARHTLVVENGLPDAFLRFAEEAHNGRTTARVPRILFVGALYESKGVRVLLEAARILWAQGAAFTLQVVGRFESPAFEAALRALVHESGLEDRVSFPGVLVGDDKWRAYAEADIFCNPTFFEAESFGLVNLEAMMFALPVVSTRWRGIPGVVQDGVSGFLAPVRDAATVAQHLASLLADAGLRQRMGQAGREIYVRRFSLQAWRAGMARAFEFIRG